MKRHVSLLVCVLAIVALVFTFASCDTEQITHQHTYAAAWSTDGTNHWHAANCTATEACKTATAALEAHVDNDNNKLCDVCGYDYAHTHAYATEYTSDATSHWYAASCGCTIDVSGKAAHTDANNDGACDVCAYNGGHTHDIDENAWAMDATDHWKAVNCGHSVEEKEAHELDDMGLCAVCGYVDGAIDVKKAVEMGVFYDYLVNGGIVSYVYDTYSTSYETATYALGNGVSNIVIPPMSEYDMGSNNWYILTETGILAYNVTEDFEGNEALASVYGANSSFVNGYAFADVFGYDDEDTDTYYGVAALLAGLYEIASADEVVSEYVVAVDGETFYCFDIVKEFEVSEGDFPITYEVSVVFSLSENYAVNFLTVTSDKVDYFEIYEYGIDETTGEWTETVVGYEPELVPAVSRVYTVAQTEGSREDVKAPYSADEIIATDFELVDADGNVVPETFEMVAGTYASFSITGIVPETAVLELNNVEVSGEGVSPSYWSTLFVAAGAPGEATLTVSTINVTKTYKINVTVPPVSEIYFTGFGDSVVDTVNVFSKNNQATFTFGAIVNAYANGAYTAQLDPRSMMSSTLTANDDGTYTVVTNTDMGGYATVSIMIASDENPDVTAMITVNVIPVPELKDVLVGDYKIEYYMSYVMPYSMNVSVNFAPASEGATSGVMTVVGSWMDYSIWEEYNVTDVYNYSVVDGELVTELVSTTYGDEAMPISIIINDNYGISVTDVYGATEELTKVEPVSFEPGEYRYNMYDENDSLKGCYQLIINTDGTGSFKYRTWDSAAFTWTDVFTTALTWEADSEGIAILVTDATYLVSGTYAYGEYENSYGMLDYGIINVAVMEGEAMVFYTFPISEFYN